MVGGKEGLRTKIIILFLALLSLIGNAGCVPTESTPDKDFVRCKEASGDAIDICQGLEDSFLHSTVRLL